MRDPSPPGTKAIREASVEAARPQSRCGSRPRDDFRAAINEHIVLLQSSILREHEQVLGMRESHLQETITRLQHEVMELRMQLHLPASEFSSLDRFDSLQPLKSTSPWPPAARSPPPRPRTPPLESGGLAPLAQDRRYVGAETNGKQFKPMLLAQEKGKQDEATCQEIPNGGVVDSAKRTEQSRPRSPRNVPPGKPMLPPAALVERDAVQGNGDVGCDKGAQPLEQFVERAEYRCSQATAAQNEDEEDFEKNECTEFGVDRNGAPQGLQPVAHAHEKEHKKRKKGQRDGKLFSQNQSQQKKLDEEDYDVAQFYYETGFCQRIARHDIFSYITLAVIAANAIYIGVDADNNQEAKLIDADIGFQICENIFCVFFTFEWLVRFGAFRRKCDCLQDRWFKFDTFLVGLMVFETWLVPLVFTGSGGIGIPTGLVKLLRLLRLARMARLMRALPELVAMVKGVRQAGRAVGSALLLLGFLVYIFGIIMYTMLKEETAPEIREKFDRLGHTMWTLLIDGSLMDSVGSVAGMLLDHNDWMACLIFMLFILGSALTVMNMLIGVLCEVVSHVAAAEKEDCQIKLVKGELLWMLKDLDTDGSGELSRTEIQSVLTNQGAKSVLAHLGVSTEYLVEQLDMFYEARSGELTILEIMELILMLRGDRAPTMKDILHGQTFNRWKVSKAIAASEREMQEFMLRLLQGDDAAQSFSERARKADSFLEVIRKSPQGSPSRSSTRSVSPARSSVTEHSKGRVM